MRASRISLFVLQLPPRFRRVAPFHSHAQAICSELGRERAEREGTNPLRLCEPDFAKKINKKVALPPLSLCGKSVLRKEEAT